MISDKNVDTKLNTTELEAWRSFNGVVYGFLGNKKEANHKQLIRNLLKTYQKLGCRMSLKIQFLHSHFDFFPENLSSVSNEQGERFYQDILRMEQLYKGKWDVSMMSDYCLFPIREYLTTHKKKSLK